MMNKENVNIDHSKVGQEEVIKIGGRDFHLSPASEERKHNVGTSDYSKHKIQPWDIWMEYHLNPWDADIVKRILRTKLEESKSAEDSRILDYQKIIHICQERIRQINNGYKF